jgi:hypothetical protein
MDDVTTQEHSETDAPAAEAAEQQDANVSEPTQDDAMTDATAADDVRAEDPATEELAAATDEAVKSDSEKADEDDVVDSALERPNVDVIPEKSGGVRRLAMIAAAVLGAGLLMTLAGVAYATYDFKNEHEDQILPGAVIGGVDVGGMTKAEAIKAVGKAIRPELTRTVSVQFGDREWEVTPKQLGARSTARAAVRTALAASEEASWLDLASMRFLNEEFDVNESVSVRYNRGDTEDYVAGLRKEIDVDPRDADLDYSSGWVEIVKERVGHQLIVDDSTKSLMSSLRAGNPVAELEVKNIEPAVTSAAYDQVLLVRQGDFKVYMYTDGKITHEWPVAIGTGGYPTPTGEYSVELKRYMPTWINPAPDGWGKSMPAMIPPGPSNPLGLRAINWTAPGIRFHGTSATSSIGTAASHGCVRMYNEDVIELYDLVEEGSPIISIWG